MIGRKLPTLIEETVINSMLYNYKFYYEMSSDSLKYNEYLNKQCWIM